MMNGPRAKLPSWPTAFAVMLALGGTLFHTSSHAALARGAGGGDGLNIIARGASAGVETALSLVPLSVPDVGLAPAASTRAIDGALGGVVSAGRFTVIVPPGAFLGTGHVTISVPDPNRLECEMSIDPAERNGFSIPVTLSVNAVGAVTANPFSLCLGWWDPVQRKWVPVSGSAEDNLTLRLSAPLYHFSKYGCFDSKAGW